MKFDKHFPCARLQPYIKYLVVSENPCEQTYKVLPSPGLVIGFQYKGHLSAIRDNAEQRLNSAGITGISDRYKIFKNSPGTGTILVYFTETGFTHFTSLPANELFNLSTSLHDIFDASQVNEVEERLNMATSDKQRLTIVEKFFLTQLKSIATDKLIAEAVKLIYQSKGTIRIKELNERLSISASPFEKKFRHIVGTTPKKFASIVRFNAVLKNLGDTTAPELCYEHNFFDQAHFIKDFRQFTGNTPESFKRFL